MSDQKLWEWRQTEINPDTWVLGQRDYDGEKLENICGEVTRQPDGRWEWRITANPWHGEPITAAGFEPDFFEACRETARVLYLHEPERPPIYTTNDRTSSN